jgi:hypothetical protein
VCRYAAVVMPVIVERKTVRDIVHRSPVEDHLVGLSHAQVESSPVDP